jgi:hypothetical protein
MEESNLENMPDEFVHVVGDGEDSLEIIMMMVNDGTWMKCGPPVSPDDKDLPRFTGNKKDGFISI